MRGGQARPDVIIIGAGIIGAACAESLSRHQVDVMVLDSDHVGCGTTACAMGHLVVMDDSEAQFALTKRSRDLWTQLAPELPAVCEDEPTGTLWVAADDEELAAVAPKATFYRSRGVRAEMLDEQQLREAEPHLRPGLAGGLLIPDDRVLYPPLAAKFFLERAIERGARLFEGVAALELGPHSVRTQQYGWLSAGHIVLAAGFTSARLLPGLSVTPRKGHLIITDRMPGFARHQLIELGYLKSAHTPSKQSVAFNLQPRATGQLLLGSSREFVGFDATLNAALRQEMIARALTYMPDLAAAQAVRSWVGFRPCTPDNLPLIGWASHHPGLLLATGHEGLGITTATGTAELITDLILERRGLLDPTHYDPERPMEMTH